MTKGMTKTLVGAITILGIFFTLPFLVEHIQRFSIASALQTRFGDRFHYEEIVRLEDGWKLKNVHVDTAVAQISCKECFLALRSFPVTLALRSFPITFAPVTLADLTAEADVLWLDSTLPTCRIHLAQGSGSLLDGASYAPLLTWTSNAYHLHALPCRIALPLLHFLSPYLPPNHLVELLNLDLESWSVESGTISGHLRLADHLTHSLADPAIDLTMHDLSLRSLHTPLHLILKEGRWHSTPEAICTGSAHLCCTLSTPPTSTPTRTLIHTLDIPKEAWNLSIQHHGIFLTLQSTLKDLCQFFGATVTNTEPLSLNIHFPQHQTNQTLHQTNPLDQLHFQMDGLHGTTGKTLEAWSGNLHIDKDTITASDLDGYLSGIHLTGKATYSPLQIDALALHLTSASGKISAFQKLLKEFPSFSFLATLPCEGYVTLSQEGATFTWSPSSPSRYRLSGSLLDLTLLGAEQSMNTHDLSCRWRYDSTCHAFDLYNLHGTLTMENGTPMGESYLLRSDLLCSFNNHCPKMDFDFWVGNPLTEKMVRFAGVVKRELGKPFLVECCPERTHFGSTHPTECCLALGDNGSLQEMHLKLPLQLEESLDLLQRINRIPYCTVDPLFTKWLQRLQKVQGKCNLSFHYHSANPALRYHLQADRLLIENQEVRNCLIEGQLHPQHCVIDTLQANACQLSASLTKTDEGWKIPYLAFQYGENLLLGFEGHFTRSTHTLEGTIPLLTWTLPSLPSSPLYPSQICWKGKGRLMCHIGGQDLLHATLVPEGQSPHWPLRPLTLTLQHKSTHYLLQGCLEDPTHPLWVEARAPDPFDLPTEWHLYDAPPAQKPPLTIKMPSQNPQNPQNSQNSQQITVQGDLWDYTCHFCYDPHQHTIEGCLAWKTLQNSPLPPPLLRTPLHALPLQASWQLTGKGSLSNSLEGTLSVSSGLIHGFPLPAWKAKIHWHPPILELHELLTLDPHLSCTLQKLKLTSGIEKTFKLTQLTAQEKPLCAKSKGRLTFPWHPHITFPFLEITALEGPLTPPYHYTGQGSLQFHRPSTQKRIASDDPLHALIPLPDVLTPRQGTLIWSVHNGEWHIKELKNAYSEGKLVEFLLVPTRPALISKTGEIDITLQTRPAKHRLRGVKQIFHLQGPIRQPSCVQVGKE